MQDDQTDAYSRIARALDRIEAQLDARAPSARRADELERLRAAHQRLRGQVQEAVTAIDRLLEEG